ncbi:MAG: cupin-like domain-containing protein [Solirubrobacteraceae bacterium]|nr:cupin-like domain-containing protein [Patulibacter sp.]
MAGPGTPMTAEWAKWIATNALAGVNGEALAKSMMEAGFTQEVAVREVNNALTHPYLEAAAQLGVGQNGVPAPASSGTKADKFEWFLDNERRLNRMSSQYGEVPRVHKPSRQEFLDNFYSQNRPVVITGALDDWDAIKKWNGDYLKEKCGDKVVEVQANRNSDANYEMNAVKHKKEMKFAEIVDIIESGVETNDWYITANNSGKNKAALIDLWDDITFPEYLDPNHVNGNGFFWYGPAGTVTPIHHDLTNNFMAQVRGSKRVKIIAPSDSPFVYNDRHCFSPVDLENIDLEKFPDMAKVNVFDVDIHPGDLFFLPVGWWHHVRGLELSITMTFTNFVYDNDFFSGYSTFDTIS